jgi:diguanylate cyclase (GGDEF)-like protein/PAS domain S-box-containing protein
MEGNRMKKAEDELALRAQLLDNANDSIVLHDFEGRLHYVNEVACRFYGYTSEELLQKKVFDLNVVESAEDHQFRLNELKTKGRAVFDTVFGKDGALIPVEVNSSVIDIGGKQFVLSVARDITKRKEAEEALLRTTAELQAVFHVLPDLYFRLSADGTFLQLLAGRPSDLYLPTEDLIGKRIQDVSKTLSEQFQQAIDQVLKTQSLVVIEYPMTLQGERRFFEARFLPLLDNQVIVVVRNITERKHLEDMLQLMSRSDGLTGIANRRLFDERLHSEWMRAARYSRPLSLIMCDVDYFKEYNDTYGHLLGDDCLKQVANVLHNAAKRASDLPARYGGDEFAVILPDIETEGAALLAEETRSGVEKLRIENNNSPFMNVTISAGVATLYPSPNASPVDLIAASDKALYAAKKNGHNRAELCSAS